MSEEEGRKEKNKFKFKSKISYYTTINGACEDNKNEGVKTLFLSFTTHYTKSEQTQSAQTPITIDWTHSTWTVQYHPYSNRCPCGRAKIVAHVPHMSWEITTSVA